MSYERSTLEQLMTSALTLAMPICVLEGVSPETMTMLSEHGVRFLIDCTIQTEKSLIAMGLSSEQRNSLATSLSERGVYTESIRSQNDIVQLEKSVQDLIESFRQMKCHPQFKDLPLRRYQLPESSEDNALTKPEPRLLNDPLETNLHGTP